MRNKSTAQKTVEIKQKIHTTDRELHHLTEAQWSYSKHMLKFSTASWILGLSSFFSTITIMDLNLLETNFSNWIPLLILALAAPVTLTVLLVRKFVVKIKHLELVRRKLLSEYEKAILTRVGELIF